MGKTRARGKKRTAKASAVQHKTPKQKQRKAAPPPGSGKKQKSKHANSRPPWLMPLLVFVGLGVAVVVALFATAQGK